MAFDVAPQLAPANLHCRTCPVRDCASRCPELAGSRLTAVTLLPPQMPGATLVQAGCPVSSLFTVRAGCVKSFTLDAMGNEHVRAFYFPGDVVGLDSLGESRSSATAAAVTPSQVCAVPLAAVQKQMADDPSIAAHLLHKTRQALRRAMALSGEFAADQRVAAFLLHVHSRIGSGDVVRLPMTRREMGSYLRLATETVCRVLTRFAKNGWVDCADKRITLLDRGALAELAEPIAF